jgi:hypothetical protein
VIPGFGVVEWRRIDAFYLASYTLRSPAGCSSACSPEGGPVVPGVLLSRP